MMYLSFSTVARRVFSNWIPPPPPPPPLRTDADVDRCSNGSPPPAALATLPALASLSGGRHEPLRSAGPLGVGGKPEERRSRDREFMAAFAAAAPPARRTAARGRRRQGRRRRLGGRRAAARRRACGPRAGQPAAGKRAAAGARRDTMSG
jgi:hypothetical protein